MGRHATKAVESGEKRSSTRGGGEWPRHLCLPAITVALLLTFAVQPCAAESIPLDRDFVLMDDRGRTVSTADFRGRWLLVYFGYIHCSDLCPTALTALAEVVAELGPAAEAVQPLFVTVDPERDKGDALRRFTAAFDPRILGLGGTPEQIAAIARAFGVKYEKVPLDAEDYVVDHSTTLTLIAPDGRRAQSITAAEPALVTAAIFAALARAGVSLDHVGNLGAYR